MSVNNLLSRLMTVYGEPKTDDVEGFIREYRRVLAGYSDKVIEKAADKAIETSLFWPRPAEIKAIAYSVAASVAPSRAPFTPAEHKPYIEPVARGPEGLRSVAEVMADFRKGMAEKRLAAEPDPAEIDWAKGQRDGFREMQANSPNRFHKARH
jgi:hypothetical protein